MSIDVDVDSADIIAIYNYVLTFLRPPVELPIVQALEAAHATAIAGLQPIVLRLSNADAQALADWLIERAHEAETAPGSKGKHLAASFKRVAIPLYYKVHPA